MALRALKTRHRLFGKMYPVLFVCVCVCMPHFAFILQFLGSPTVLLLSPRGPNIFITMDSFFPEDSQFDMDRALAQAVNFFSLFVSTSHNHQAY